MPEGGGGKTKNIDDWLITYADMITLLLCFFAVLLSVSIPEKVQFEQACRKLMEQFATADQINGNHTEIIKDLYILPPAIEKLEEQDGISVISRGDHITAIEMDSAASFMSGSAELSPNGIQILSDILTTLKSMKFSDCRIAIEGHTDDMPISTAQFPSNRELSTARAAAVVRSTSLTFLPIGYFRRSSRHTTANPLAVVVPAISRTIKWGSSPHADEEQLAKNSRDPVAPAKRSSSAIRKAHAKSLEDGSRVYSFVVFSTILVRLFG